MAEPKRLSLIQRLTQGLFANEIGRQVRALLSETDNSFTVGTQNLTQTRRDRLVEDRYTVLEDSLDAWRANPLARRVVELTTQYVVGGGIQIGIKHKATETFVNKFWSNRLNHMNTRVMEMCDELSRTGNLFVLISTDPGGMSYIRIIPAMSIDRIVSRENDYETPVVFLSKPFVDPYTGQSGEPCIWPAYDESLDGAGYDVTKIPYQVSPLPTNAAAGVSDTGGGFPPVMVQYTINRPVGAQWGEGDLAPILRWLTRYANWLEDRARLNRFRNAFMWVVHAKFTSETERLARQTKLAANPPQPGSVLVVDESETWEVLSAKLEASDANNDGLALKKMIAGGAGVPMHFLAEPESSTTTTAVSAGGPTYRRFEQRQLYFLWMISDILRIVINRRAMVDHRVSRSADVTLRGADISGRDTAGLSQSAANIAVVAGLLRDRGLIDDEEMLRLIYAYASEVVDTDEMLARGKAAGVAQGAPAAAASAPGAPAVGANLAPQPDQVPDESPAGTGESEVKTGEQIY